MCGSSLRNSVYSLTLNKGCQIYNSKDGLKGSGEGSQICHIKSGGNTIITKHVCKKDSLEKYQCGIEKYVSIYSVSDKQCNKSCHNGNIDIHGYNKLLNS